MGWSHGTEVVGRLAPVLQQHIIDAAARAEVYKVLLDVLRDLDWDCEDEAQGLDPVLDEQLNLNEEEF